MSTQTVSKWSIDPIHSDIHFKVKHLMINTVTGSFKKFDATLETTADDLSDAKIAFTADVASVETGMEMRDTHLKSDEFFNAEKFPQLKFTSTAFTKVKNDSYKLKGDLTIRDITKPVELDVEYGGKM